jgi:hypothetical protein
MGGSGLEMTRRNDPMKQAILFILAAVLLSAFGCAKSGSKAEAKAATFKEDVAFLQQYTRAAVLEDAGGWAQIAVNPDLQGRVMTSTAGGPDGLSFGWINRAAISSRENNLHMNAFGGEDRFWLGPEGGQFSIFFKKGAPFNLDNWFTPPPINEGEFRIVSQQMSAVHFRKAVHLVNYSGAEFDLEVNRIVSVLEKPALAEFGINLPEGVRGVVYSTDNSITNTGLNAWTRETGLLSIWILGMFNPSPATTIVVPFKTGEESALGPIVNDAYFGKVPADRLIVGNGVLYFKGDGLFRSKIGLSPRRAMPFAGSYDAANGVLTLVHLTLPEGATEYVNSMWEIQKEPFAGDTVNSYNDGPASKGAKPLGPFYELETSSPAGALKPDGILRHVHTTMHFQGPEAALDGIARKTLGVGIAEIKAAFAGK